MKATPSADPGRPAPRRRRRRAGWLLALGVLAAGLGLLGGYRIFLASLDSAVDAELAALDREGLGVGWDALRPDVERDAAAHLERAASQVGPLGAHELEIIWHRTASFAGEAIAHERLCTTGCPDDERRREQTDATVGALLAGREAARAEIAAAIACDGARFEHEPGEACAHAHPTLLARVEQLAAVEAARSGRAREAWDAIARDLHLVRLDDDAMCEPWFPRARLERDAVALVRALIAHAPPSGAQGDRLIEVLRTVERPAAYRTFERTSLRRALDASATMLALSDDELRREIDVRHRMGEESLFAVSSPRLARPLLRRDRAALVALCARRIRAISDDGSPAALGVYRATALQAEGLDAYHGWTKLHVASDLSERVYASDIDRRARNRLAQAALLAAARAADGPLPARLAGLPGDPWRPDRPLGWRRVGPRRGVLWSVGADGLDAGGRVAVERGKSSREGGDIVFTLRLPGAAPDEPPAEPGDGTVLQELPPLPPTVPR